MHAPLTLILFSFLLPTTLALPLSSTLEPMVLSCTSGSSALECYKLFSTTCDDDCNIIHPAPVSIAHGDCSDILGRCSCVDITSLNGTDASGLGISAYRSPVVSATATASVVVSVNGTRVGQAANHTIQSQYFTSVGADLTTTTTKTALVTGGMFGAYHTKASGATVTSAPTYY